MFMHFPSTAVVNSTVIQPTSPPTDDVMSIKNRLRLILGICLGGFGLYVSTGSTIAVHFYWFLPAIASGTVHVSFL